MFPRITKGNTDVAIKVSDAKRLAAAIDAGGYDMFVDYANDPAVVAEIEMFRNFSDRNDLARRAIIFSMLSPQAKFHLNIVAFNAAYPIYDANDMTLLVEACKPTPYHVGKANSITRAVNALSGSVAKIMSKEFVLSLHGMGEKTASFAMAMFNDSADVWTLDVHMLRSILWAIDGNGAVNPTISPAAYGHIEAAMVRWCKRHGIESPFTAQWSIWNAWRGMGHETHLAVLGLS